MDTKDNKVDVILHIYGKPWQTLNTLKSLIQHSGEWIDKIYFVKEPKHPFGDNVDWVEKHFNNLIIYTTKRSILMNICRNLKDDSERWNMYCQYAMEKSDKKYVFVTHNDQLYTEDIIGEMLKQIEDNIAIGSLGQCWNCPALEYCGGGEKWSNWNPNEEEIKNIKSKLPHIRTRIDNLDKEVFKLMPECRLNEWGCLINREMSNKETYPNGNTPFFGEFNPDSGVPWFKSLNKKGYKFKNYSKGYIHGFWANNAGYPTSLNEKAYWKAEEIAKKYFEENYK